MNKGGNKNEPQVPVLQRPLSAGDAGVPLLNDRAQEPRPSFTEEQLAAVQAQLISMTRDLTDRLLDGAIRDMEAALFDKVSNRLREELPALIEQALRENLEPRD